LALGRTAKHKEASTPTLIEPAVCHPSGKGIKRGQDCEPALDWKGKRVTASLPCGSTVLVRAVSFHWAPLIKTQRCPSASAPASSVISISMIIWHRVSARHNETDSHFQKQFIFIVKTIE